MDYIRIIFEYIPIIWEDSDNGSKDLTSAHNSKFMLDVAVLANLT